jgi:hypothetical protein
MKNFTFLLILLFAFSGNYLFAQRLELESILELNFEPFKIYRIDDERSLIVTQDRSYCKSHRLDFLYNDKVVNSVSLPEGFVGNVKVEGDEIQVLTPIQAFDVSGIYGVRRYLFDLDGELRMMPEEFHFINFDVQHTFQQAFIAETVEGIFVHNYTGHLYNAEHLPDNYLSLNAQFEGNFVETKVKKLEVYEGTGAGGLVVRQLLYATESKIYTYNINVSVIELSTLELDDIRYAGVSDDNEILVVHGSTVSLFDFELNEIAHADMPQAMDFFYEEEGLLHAMKPFAEPDSVIIYQDCQYINFDLNTMTVIDEKVITGVGARMADFYAEDGRIHILSSSGSGKQVVLQKFDLNTGIESHIYTDIAIGDYQVVDIKRFTILIPSIEATLELPVQNLSEEFISEIRYGSYFDYIFGFACGEEVFGNVDVQLGFLDEEVIRVKVKCNRFTTVDGGDSLLYTCPCVDIFPYEHHLDLDESNNQVCAQIKVSSTMVSTEEELFNQNWTIFPNPVKNDLFIQTTDLSIKTADWQIMDLTGRMVDSGVVFLSDGLQQIPLLSMNPGMYIFQLSDTVTGRIIGVKRLVKE